MKSKKKWFEFCNFSSFTVHIYKIKTQNLHKNLKSCKSEFLFKKNPLNVSVHIYWMEWSNNSKNNRKKNELVEYSILEWNSIMFLIGIGIIFGKINNEKYCFCIHRLSNDILNAIWTPITNIIEFHPLKFNEQQQVLSKWILWPNPISKEKEDLLESWNIIYILPIYTIIITWKIQTN